MFRRPDTPVRLRRPVRGGMLHQFHAKMNRMPAHLTSEDDWKHDQPGVRLSRVFGVVLGIHIVAIGGLMAYEMFRHREHPVANATGLRPAAREVRPASGSAASEVRVTDAFADDPAHDGLRKHVVGSRERLADIAAQYGVDEKALMVKNRLNDGRAFQSGMRLVIPNRQLQAAAPADPARLLAAAPAALPASAASLEAAPAATAPSDGLVPVTPAPYDPSLPTRRAEAITDSSLLKSVAPSAKKSTARTETASSAKPTPTASANAKKPAALAVKKTEAAPTKPKTKGRIHVVKEGENAYRIAKAYGVNLDHLIKTNGINPNTLRPGTALTIPPVK